MQLLLLYDLLRVQVCHAAASKPMWQLRGGRLVQLRDGCFLQVYWQSLWSYACHCDRIHQLVSSPKEVLRHWA